MILPSLNTLMSSRDSKNSSGRSRQNTGRTSETESGSFKRFKANLNKKNIDAMDKLEHWNINIRWNNGNIYLSILTISLYTSVSLSITINVDIENEHGLNNKVITTKYTLLTWLPKSIFEQFRRLANCYFLAIIILMVRTWSHFNIIFISFNLHVHNP